MLSQTMQRMVFVLGLRVLGVGFKKKLGGPFLGGLVIRIRGIRYHIEVYVEAGCVCNPYM